MGRVLASVWLLALPLVGCSPGQADTARQAPSAADPHEVRRAEFQNRILLTGELEAVQSQKIRVPRTPSWRLPIRWLEVDGTLVEPGQKVLELDNGQFSGELEQKRLAEISAYNDLLGRQAELESERADAAFQYERQRIELEKRRIEAAIPEALRSRRDHQEKQLELVRAESEFAKARQDIDTARQAADAALEELRVQLQRARDEVRTAENAIEALTVNAPGAGILVVSESRDEGRKYQVGDDVWVGLEVASIPDLGAMQVVARLSDVDDGRVAPGQRVVCSLDTYPNRTFHGEVAEISPIAQQTGDSIRRAFQVTVLLDESDPEMMRPGMSVKLEVLDPPIPDALLAPRRAIEIDDDGPRLVLDDDTRIPVTVGPCNAGECVITEGAREGQRLGVRG